MSSVGKAGGIKNVGGTSSMNVAKNAIFYLSLIATSALLLIIEHLTHFEFLYHLAAIPIEVLIAVFIVERLLERRELKQTYSPAHVHQEYHVPVRYAQFIHHQFRQSETPRPFHV